MDVQEKLLSWLFFSLLNGLLRTCVIVVVFSLLNGCVRNCGIVVVVSSGNGVLRKCVIFTIAMFRSLRDVLLSGWLVMDAYIREKIDLIICCQHLGGVSH